MMASHRSITAAVILLSLLTQIHATCDSYGLDIQDGGTYFQNNASTAPFTALQEFSGCQNDTADNILVDPNGDQSECTQTPLLPDDTPELVTCSDWPKDKLYSGDWSLLIISNNGDGDPIAYERDFSLTVGAQQTTTVTPTVTVSDILTPVVSSTTTTTTIVTIVLSTSTVPGASTGTITVTPRASTKTITEGALTITQTIQSLEIDHAVITVPASCSVYTTSGLKDPIATIVPTILGELDSVASSIIVGLGGLLGGLSRPDKLDGRDVSSPVATPTAASAKFKRAILESRTPSEEIKRAFVEERRARLSGPQLNKRAPDQPTVTSTETTVVVTSTYTSIASTQTVIVTNTVSRTRTSTPAPITGHPSTVTEPASTRTTTLRMPVVVTTFTQVFATTITNTVTTTSSGAAEACASSGGALFVKLGVL